MLLELNLRGLACPVPVSRTKRALKKAVSGDIIIAICTDPLSVIDIPALVHSTGDILELEQKLDTEFIFKIRKA